MSKLKKICENLKSANPAFYEQRTVERILPSSCASSASTECLIIMSVIVVKCHIKSVVLGIRRPFCKVLCLCAIVVLAQTWQLQFQFLALISVWLFESDLNYSPHFPVCKMRWESTNVCTDIGLLGHTEEIDSDKSSFLAHFQIGLFD